MFWLRLYELIECNAGAFHALYKISKTKDFGDELIEKINYYYNF